MDGDGDGDGDGMEMGMEMGMVVMVMVMGRTPMLKVVMYFVEDDAGGFGQLFLNEPERCGTAKFVKDTIAKFLFCPFKVQEVIGAALFLLFLKT